MKSKELKLQDEVSFCRLGGRDHPHPCPPKVTRAWHPENLLHQECIGKATAGSQDHPQKLRPHRSRRRLHGFPEGTCEPGPNRGPCWKMTWRLPLVQVVAGSISEKSLLGKGLGMKKSTSVCIEIYRVYETIRLRWWRKFFWVDGL